MGMGVRGDFGKLKTLIGQVRGLARAEVVRVASKTAAAAALAQVKKEFRGSVDPYGTPWAPLKVRKGKPLLNTGVLRSSFTATATPHGFEIGSAAAYATFHQTGTRFIPARAMLPVDGNLGPTWSGIIEKSVTGAWRAAWRS